MKTRAALFDIDGTLLHGHGSGRRAFLRAMQEVTGRAIDDHGFSFAGRTDLQILRELLTRNDCALPDAETQRFIERYCAALEEELLAVAGAKLYPGVLEILNALEAEGSWAIGLLTGNLREGARRKLSTVGLWDRFDFGAFGDDHEDRNRLVPVALRRLEEAHGLLFEPTRAIVIGDTERDVACARAGGAYVLGVRNGWDDGRELLASRPDAYFEDLSDTKAVLAALDAMVPLELEPRPSSFLDSPAASSHD